MDLIRIAAGKFIVSMILFLKQYCTKPGIKGKAGEKKRKKEKISSTLFTQVSHMGSVGLWA